MILLVQNLGFQVPPLFPQRRLGHDVLRDVLAFLVRVAEVFRGNQLLAVVPGREHGCEVVLFRCRLQHAKDGIIRGGGRDSLMKVHHSTRKLSPWAKLTPSKPANLPKTPKPMFQNAQAAGSPKRTWLLNAVSNQHRLFTNGLRRPHSNGGLLDR